MRATVPALLLFAALWAGARLAPGLGAWAFGLAALALAVPLALIGAYGAAMRRHRKMHLLSRDGWLRRYLSGPVLRVAISLVVAVALAVLLMIRVIGLGLAEWGALVITALAVPLCAALWDRLAGAQIAPEYRHVTAITAGRMLGAVLALGAYLALRGAPVEIPTGPFQSALVEQAVLVGAQWRLLEDFALGQLAVLGDWGRLAAGIAAALGTIALVWTAAGIPAAFLMRRGDLGRALAPIGADRPGPAAMGWTAALATVIVLFLYLPGLATTEAALRDLPGEDRPAEIFVTRVEEIGGRFFTPGTIAEITGRRIELQAEAAPGARQALQAGVDEGFDAMIANVDPFLDWYYSLPAEYARIAHLLAGDFEAYLARKMTEHLSQGDPFDGLQAELARLEALDDAIRPALSEELQTLARTRQVQIAPDQPLAVTGRAEAQVLLGLDGAGIAASVADGLHRRMVVAGGTAGVTGALTTAVMAKMGAKGVTKVAAKAAVKVAASKGIGGTAGAGAGAAAGGLVGSVVPGLGTVAGALVGGVIGGLAAGVGTDFLLIKLEETLSRDTLRTDMIVALDDSRAEVQALVPEPPSTK